MGDRDYHIQPSRRPLLGATNNALIMLIAVNAILFIMLNFLNLVYRVSYATPAIGDTFFKQQILTWFTLTPQPNELATKPWTILLYMITNFNAITLVSNLLWLWCFGYILQDLSGNKKLIPIYIYGGFVGAIFFLLSVNFIPTIHNNMATYEPMIGSGAAVIAVAVATTCLAPTYKIFPLIKGGIPLWILTLVFVVIDFASVGRESFAVAIAHVGGALMGFVFVRFLAKGIDIGAWMNHFSAWVNDLFNPEKKHVVKGEKHFYKAEKAPYEKVANITQQKLDTILDKINVHGYAMLTDEEKDFLKRASKEEL